LANFNDTLLYLRGNTSIDYEQLGLKFRLYSCEVLFNRGLCYVYLQQMVPGLQDLSYAAKEKVTSDHDVIDDAIRENADVWHPTLSAFFFAFAVDIVLTLAGIHGILNPRRRAISPQCSQGEKPQVQGLPRQGKTGRGIRSVSRGRPPMATHDH
jgi:hypothetical protein